MNDTAMIFALALASNRHPQQNFTQAFQQISALGEVQFSPIYLIPCRDSVGADYWNCCCLIQSDLTLDQMTSFVKKLETESGRVRPSHQISLDVDVIAWGSDLNHMLFNPKKLPLALDVKIPMFDIWEDQLFEHYLHSFPKVELNKLSINTL